MNRKTMQIILIAVGALMCAFGVYLSFFETRGFVKTTAIIDRIEETWTGTDPDGGDSYTYDVWVTYSAEGRTYSGKLDTYSSDYREGKRIRIWYDPENPERIHGDSRQFGLYLMIGGPVLSAVGAVTLALDKKKERENGAG